MPYPTLVPLGASTPSSKWKLDVDTSLTVTPSWVRVMGIAEFKPTLSLTSQDDSDYDSGGDKSSTVTAREWGAEFKCLRKTQAATATAYDAGQEFLRLRAEQIGLANSAKVRFYEDNGAGGPKVEAYEGRCSVDWSPEGGAMDALDTVSVTLMGQGKRTAIAHPGTP